MSDLVLSEMDQARLDLLQHLENAHYRFSATSPTTHRRVLIRRGLRCARNLIDVFGWNLPFHKSVVGTDIFNLMISGKLLRRANYGYKSLLRVAHAGQSLFYHSAFGAVSPDRVFFGPDSLRFAEFVRAETSIVPAGATIVDVGAGSGVGGLTAASRVPGSFLTLCDVNSLALDLARVNAAFAKIAVTLLQSDGMSKVQSSPDLVLANPPYVGGTSGPIYSRGGGRHGEQLSIDWATQAADRLAPGGRLLLYTGSAIVDGNDRMHTILEGVASAAECELTYRELDPDILPELLLGRSYWGVERIAAVGAVVKKPG